MCVWLHLLNATHQHLVAHARPPARLPARLPSSQVCMIGDGQVSMGSMVAKPNAKKIRRIGETVGAHAPCLPP